MEILLIRHAEPVRQEVAEGRADPPLSERGRQQAQRLAEWLRGERVDAIWTSPQRRAIETGAPLAEAAGLAPRIDERLAEYDRDDPDYIPIEELQRTNHPRWRALSRSDWAALSSVPLEVFLGRIEAALFECIAAHPGGRVAVVCHGGVINVWAGALLGIPRPLWFRPAYASVSRVAASRSGVRSLVSLNEVPRALAAQENPQSAAGRG